MDMAIKELNLLDFEVENDGVFDVDEITHKMTLTTSKVWHFSF